MKNTYYKQCKRVGLLAIGLYMITPAAALAFLPSALQKETQAAQSETTTADKASATTKTQPAPPPVTKPAASKAASTAPLSVFTAVSQEAEEIQQAAASGKNLPTTVVTAPAAPSTNTTNSTFQVYIENHTSESLTAQVFVSGASTPLSTTTKANDRNWININKSCISYVTFSTASAAARWDFANGSPQCTNLAFSITLDGNNNIQIMQVTNNNNRTKGAMTSGISALLGTAVAGKLTIQQVSTAQSQQQAAAQKTSFQVYIENHTDISLNAIVTLMTTSGFVKATPPPVTKTIKANDRDWLQLSSNCIKYISLQNTSGSAQVTLPSSMNACTNLSLYVTTNSNGELEVTQATEDANLNKKDMTSPLVGNPVNVQVTFQALTTLQQALANNNQLQVYVENHSARDIDIHVYVKPGGTAAIGEFIADAATAAIAKTAAPDGAVSLPVMYYLYANSPQGWISLGTSCIDYIIMHTFTCTARWDWPTGANTCSNLALALSIDSGGKIIVTQATNDANVGKKGITGPLQGTAVSFNLTYPPSTYPPQ